MLGITGAGGQLGSAVVEDLREIVPVDEIVAFTRHPERLAELARSGVTVRQADFDGSGLVEAFTGVSSLLLVSTDAVGARLPGHLAAVSAAHAAGVQRVIYTSVPEPVKGNPALVAPDHAATEQAIMDSGMDWTMLRNGLYADLQVADIIEAARTGKFWSNTGDGSSGYVTRADAARVAAHVLASTDFSETVLDVTGPEALDAAGLAAIAQKLRGDRVEVAQVDDDTFRSRLVGFGVPAPVAGVVTSINAAIREGFFDQVNAIVREVTNREPESVESLVASANLQ